MLESFSVVFVLSRVPPLSNVYVIMSLISAQRHLFFCSHALLLNYDRLILEFGHAEVMHICLYLNVSLVTSFQAVQRIII